MPSAVSLTFDHQHNAEFLGFRRLMIGVVSSADQPILSHYLENQSQRALILPSRKKAYWLAFLRLACYAILKIFIAVAYGTA